MSKRYMLNLLFLLWGSIVINQTVFAHGYQTAPYSRIAHTVDSGQKAQLNYNQNQISNNLPNNLGNKTLQQIIDYVSETNGTGPLAFYKDHYTVHSDQLCAYAANNQGYLPILNKSLPENKMTEVSAGDPVQFKWGYSAWHTPSNNFVFITEYPAGKYKSNPSLSDLHFVCAVTADSSGAWQCKLPIFSGDSKQVLVTLWQRVDAAGENFISCADVKVENGTVVPPENIWSLIDNKIPWTSALIEQPKAGDIVHFTLEAEKNESAQKSLLAKYSLSITPTNLAQWESILASKINNDTTYSKIIVIGQLNTTQGNVVYDQTDRNNNYVYLNKTIAAPKTIYNYNLTIEKDPNPVIIGWQPIGEPLKVWVNSGNVKTNDRLQLAVQIAGVEHTLEVLTVNNPNNAEKLIAEQVSKSEFNGLKFAAGVLQGSGQQANVSFVENENNRVYVYRSSNDTTNVSYVIRNLSQSTTHPIYPAGIGSYKAGSLVQNKEGQVYLCVEPGWCNLTAYGLTATGAWKLVTPKAAPNGYLTYPSGRPYSKGTIVADIEGNLYKCTQAAWCNDQSGAYSPGVGRAWYISWEKQ
jgi:hypothetical protein